MSDHGRPIAKPVTSVHERRVTVRYAVQRSVYCQVGTGGSNQFWRFAKMLDLSVDGVRLALTHGFPPGEKLLIELTSFDGNLCRTMSTRIVHTTEEGSAWVIGCVFEQSLTEDELHSLL